MQIVGNIFTKAMNQIRTRWSLPVQTIDGDVDCLISMEPEHIWKGIRLIIERFPKEPTNYYASFMEKVSSDGDRIVLQTLLSKVDGFWGPMYLFYSLVAHCSCPWFKSSQCTAVDRSTLFACILEKLGIGNTTIVLPDEAQTPFGMLVLFGWISKFINMSPASISIDWASKSLKLLIAGYFDFPDAVQTILYNEMKSIDISQPSRVSSITCQFLALKDIAIMNGFMKTYSQLDHPIPMKLTDRSVWSGLTTELSYNFHVVMSQMGRIPLWGELPESDNATEQQLSSFNTNLTIVFEQTFVMLQLSWNTNQSLTLDEILSLLFFNQKGIQRIVVSMLIAATNHDRQADSIAYLLTKQYAETQKLILGVFSIFRTLPTCKNKDSVDQVIEYIEVWTSFVRTRGALHGADIFQCWLTASMTYHCILKFTSAWIVKKCYTTEECDLISARVLKNFKELPYLMHDAVEQKFKSRQQQAGFWAEWILSNVNSMLLLIKCRSHGIRNLALDYLLLSLQEISIYKEITYGRDIVQHIHSLIAGNFIQDEKQIKMAKDWLDYESGQYYAKHNHEYPAACRKSRLLCDNNKAKNTSINQQPPPPRYAGPTVEKFLQASSSSTSQDRTPPITNPINYSVHPNIISRRLPPKEKMTHLQQLKYASIQESQRLDKRQQLAPRNVLGTGKVISKIILPNSDDEAEKPEKDHRTAVLLEAPARPVGRLIRPPTNSKPTSAKKALSDVADFYEVVFGWDLEMDDLPLPPNLNRTIKMVPELFTSTEDYIKIMEPLIIVECWSTFLQSRSGINQQPTAHVVLDSVLGVDLHHELTIFGEKQALRDIGIGENTLVVLRNRERGIDIVMHVKTATHSREGMQIRSKLVCEANFYGRKHQILSHLSKGSNWAICMLMSLTTYLREYQALGYLSESPLLDDILNARIPPQMDFPAQRVKEYVRILGVNYPQACAIAAAIDTKNGFVLIEGPPGTGKTRTIIGLIGALQKHTSINPLQVRAPAARAPRLLICAPSNAAIDEITRRLMSDISSIRGDRFKPNIVRIGNLAIHSDTKSVSLEYLLEKEISASTAADGQAVENNGIEDTYRELQNAYDERENLRKSAIINDSETMAGYEADVKVINSRIGALKRKRDAEKAQRASINGSAERKRKELKDKIITDADILLCTLSGSYELIQSKVATFDIVIRF